jgi:hypothetical protein
MFKYLDDLLPVVVVSFLACVIKTLLYPQQRGLLGFASAATVGLSFGVICGMVCHELGWPLVVQFALVSVFSVFGDRLMFALMATTAEKTITYYQNNYGQAAGTQGPDAQTHNHRPGDDEPVPPNQHRPGDR